MSNENQERVIPDILPQRKQDLTMETIILLFSLYKSMYTFSMN
jgi:hypothetical protein